MPNDMRILFPVPPTKVSQEFDTVRVIPGVELVVVAATSDRARPAAYRLPSARVPWLGSPERWTAALAWLRKLDDLDPGPVDLVLTQEVFSVTSAQGVALARRLECPHVVLVAEILDSNPLYRTPPWSLWYHRVSRSADRFLCITEAARRHLVELGIADDRIVVVAPGVDTDVFHPAPALPTDPVVVFVGELRPDKGIRAVVAACDRLVGSLPGLCLLVVGDGPLREWLATAAADRPWIEVRGRVPREDIPDLLRRARVFTIAPEARRLWAEQLGFAVIEAMSCGLPVVTTNCGALPEVVSEGDQVVPQGDIDGLARALAEALGTSADERGRANRTWVLERFDLHRQAERMGEALRAVARRAAGSAA